jgi:sialate O-acetylesterase
MRFCVAAAAILACASALKLPNAIDSNMVLARAPLTPRLWGWANASEDVIVTLDGTTSVTATAAENGTWIVDLPAQQAGHGHEITVTGARTPDAPVTLTNIAFGDVYLCSGQSNMQFSVNDAFNASAEIADSSNYPDLRFYTIKLTTADTPQVSHPNHPAATDR